ncbi:MAG: hypothetical protein HeimC3_08300 [Candidatus Heimdallarchaeota archaeon LC_3]|nr:MAG: hypothetical protein HeimC3_08300 [Candidatus Heimdallarchaeota archaeon LC_3]
MINLEAERINVGNILIRFKYILITTLIAGLFAILYLGFINHIYFARRAIPLDFLLLDNWSELIFRERAAFNWEPIMRLSIGTFRFDIAVPNLFLGLFLGLIAGLNISLSIYSLTEAPKACKINPATGIMSIIPSFFSGFLCCAPTFVAVLGISSAAFTLFFIDILPFIIPFAIISSLFILGWNIRKLNKSLASSQQL